MKIRLHRWPGPMGRYSCDNPFGWRHFHLLPGIQIAWKRGGTR